MVTPDRNDPTQPVAAHGAAPAVAEGPAGVAAPEPPPWWSGISGRGVLLAAVLALLSAGVLSPLFATPFAVLLGRTLFLAMVLLLAYTVGLHWPPRWLPGWLPRWVLPPLMVALAAPLCTFVIYVLYVGGDVMLFMSSEPAIMGFSWIAGTGLIIGLLLSLGALLREREAQARQQALQFALERATLERQALDARRAAAETQLQLLQRQIEPHFLFNTLANVQALVESQSPRAPALLQSLIDYLRASVPRLEQGRPPTLGEELARVRAYLALMRMRMPDRLTLSEDIDATLHGQPFPPMLLLTLAENAVRHGIDPSEPGGHIELGVRTAAEAAPGGWSAWVRDTGVGLAEASVHGTGLRNVRETLTAFFGPRARLSVEQPDGGGVIARIDVAAVSTPAPVAAVPAPGRTG
jgi:hypothetical protein